MVSESDFITIPYTPDMTQAGIRYACISLPYTYDRMGDHYINRLRRTVARKAVELGFKRYLNKRKIPHSMLGSTPFSDPDHYDIAIGGRRCDIEGIILTKKKHIRSVHKKPHQLLNAQALVPIDQMSGDDLIDDDIFIFSFLTALITQNRRILNKAITAGQPIYMINALPHNWARPEQWGSLGNLVVKSKIKTTLSLELGGRNFHHEFQTENLILNPHLQMEVKQNFSALSYIHTPNLPDETIGVYSSTLDETYLVEPMAWSNIWIYGMQIIFGGYITRGEFRKNAKRLPQGSRGFQSSGTHAENFTIPLQGLHPLNDLFEHAKAWSQIQKF